MAREKIMTVDEWAVESERLRLEAENDRLEVATLIMASMYSGRARQLLDIDHDDCAHHACLAADALLSALDKTAKKEEKR